MNPWDRVFVFDIRDLHMEAVLDGGFFDRFALESVIHSHSYHELMLCREGEFTVTATDHAQRLKKGEVCLTPAGSYHSTRETSKDAQKLAIRFHCTEIPGGEGLYQAFGKALRLRPGIQYLENSGEISALAEQLRQEIRKGALAWEVNAQAILTQLFVAVVRSLLQEELVEDTLELTENAADNRRLRVEFYLHSHCAEAITEEDLAEHIHISKRQLSRVLQQLYGASFRKLLIDVRLSRAVQLLGTTDLSVDEVAAQVGYHSVSGFYDAFRKKFGESVGSYRKKLFR